MLAKGMLLQDMNKLQAATEAWKVCILTQVALVHFDVLGQPQTTIQGSTLITTIPGPARHNIVGHPPKDIMCMIHLFLSSRLLFLAESQQEPPP